MSPLLRAGCWAVAAGVAIAAPMLFSGFHLFIATQVVVLALFGMAYNLVFGYGGMPSLGHAAFFGLGAYVTALGVTEWGWRPELIVVVAVGLGALLGLLMGAVTLRSNGVYLLLLTLAMAVALHGLVLDQVQLTKGENGIAGIDREGLPFGMTDDAAFYYCVLVVAVVSGLMLWRLVTSPVGKTIMAARESPTRLVALGYRLWVYRLVAFGVSGLFSSLAGVLYAYLVGFVSAEAMSVKISADVLVLTILGGAATFMGPVVGAALLVTLQQVVSTYTERWVTVLGVVYILTILFLPSGITGVLRAPRWSRFRRRRAGGARPKGGGRNAAVIERAVPMAGSLGRREDE